MTPLLVRSFINEDWPCGRGRFLDPAWLAYRIDIYLRYTVPSLQRQTCQDFRIWLDCRPGSEADIEPFLARLEAQNVLVTFDRGRRHLTTLPGSPSEFYLLRIDSDDCYAPDAVELVRGLQGKAAASQFYSGYIWLAGPGVLWRMTHHSPPFYSLRLAIDENGMVWPAHAGHDSVRSMFNPVPLPDGKFCMVRHSHHSAGAPLHRPRSAGDWIRPGTVDWNAAMRQFPLG